jgi:hypothetical protein
MLLTSSFISAIKMSSSFASSECDEDDVEIDSDKEEEDEEEEGSTRIGRDGMKLRKPR